MTLRVGIYAPDRHIVYDGRTVDDVGVGGGVTARIRLAAALAGIGCDVTVVCNCPSDREVHGVKYRTLAGTSRLDAELLIFNTTGGDLDLSAAATLKISASMRMVWLGGHPKPKGLDELPYDYLCGPSNYLTHSTGDEWDIPEDRRAVFYNGLSEDQFRTSFLARGRRDPYRLAYGSHPAKGLEAAIGVLGRLRQRDPRFELHVFGGNQLWGGDHQRIDADGVIDHGLLGQRRLADELQKCAFSICLQERLEPFGIVVIEAMKAGAIVIASAVGAYSEIITNGEDGFLIEGPHLDPAVQDRAGDLILQLQSRPSLSDLVRATARVRPLSWQQVAESWLGFAEWFLSGRPETPHPMSVCPRCGGYQLALSDGFHCTSCGRYRRDLGSPLTP